MTTTKRRDRRTTPGWKLRLFGEPALISPTGREHLLEARAAALLALAALDPGISRRSAARMLWPDSADANARQALRQQVLRLKKLVGTQLLEPGTSLRLNADVSSDAAGDGGSGKLLGSFDYGDDDELARWVAQERRRRRGALVEDITLALERAEAAGDFGSAIALARRLVEADGDNERHHRALMRLYYLAGDRPQALATYEGLREMLAREYAAAPSAEAEQLLATIRSAGTGLGVAARRAPPSVLRPPRLVDREREWQALQDCWDARAAALLCGVAGMGKSRLASDFAASRGGALTVAARPGDSLAAYSVFARLARALVERLGASVGAGLRQELASLLPELGKGRPIRDAADKARMLRAVEALIGMATAAGLGGMVVDDLHFADAASLEALQGQIAAGGPRVILTYRGEQIGVPARELTRSLISSGAGQQIDLAALDEAHVAELIDSLGIPGLDGARLAPRITRHTGGNPLFVLETVKAILLESAESLAATGLPVAANVRDLIALRLGKLSARAVALARCAAIAGQDFSAELASHVMGVRPIDLADAWGELERAHVFRDGAFEHDLIHEAALASVPEAIARRLHAEIAAFLETGSTEPARIAQHWLTARRPKEASAALILASGRARVAGRRNEEASLLGQAAHCFGQVGDVDARFEALLSRAEAMLCGDLGEATRDAVAAAGTAARNDEQRVRAMLREAEYLSHRSESEEAVRVGGIGQGLAAALRRTDLEVAFAAIIAGGLCELRRVEEALAWLLPCREWVPGLPPRVAIEYLIQLGIVLDLCNRLGEALEAFEQARGTALAHGLKDLLATALSNLATTTSKRGEISRAVEYGRRALQLWREAEPLKGTPMQTQTLLAHRLRDIGHYDEAIAMLEEALEEFRHADARAWIASAAHRLALAYSHVGQHARAMKLLAEEPTGLPVKARAIWEAHRGEVARLAGSDGLVPMRTALAMLGGELDDGNNRLVALFASALLPAAEGESTAAAVAAWATSRERFGMALAAHTRAAGCALAQGAVDRSVAQAEAALRLATAYEPDNFYRAELWWVASQALLAAGRVAQADQVLAKGRDWVLGIAREHVRPEYRDSFLNRNPVNRALLAETRRRLPAA